MGRGARYGEQGVGAHGRRSAPLRARAPPGGEFQNTGSARGLAGDVERTSTSPVGAEDAWTAAGAWEMARAVSGRCDGEEAHQHGHGFADYTCWCT